MTCRHLLVGIISALLAAACHPAAAETAPKASRATCDRASFRAVIDVGHSERVPGAMSARGVNEYDFNLRLARQVEQRLVDAGFSKAFLMVSNDRPPWGLFQRAHRANAMPADLFFSIHHDSVPNRFEESWEYEGKKRHFNDRFRGHSIFISNDNPDRAGSLQFASLLGNQLKARGLKYTPHYTEKFMGHYQHVLVDPQAGVYRYDQLIVLRATRMPAALLEAGLIINRDEELVLASPERQALIASAAADAIAAFCDARSGRGAPTAAARPATPR